METAYKLLMNYIERRSGMAKNRSILLSEGSEANKNIRPALTPEAQENRMISLAMDLAMKQLREGTASSQVITHFLKLGSSKEKVEQEILEKQKELITAKTEQLKSAKKMEALYTEALSAMKAYSGGGSDNQDED